MAVQACRNYIDQNEYEPQFDRGHSPKASEGPFDDREPMDTFSVIEEVFQADHGEKSTAECRH